MNGKPDGRFDALHAEAAAALTSSANVLRDVRARYRAAYAEELERWQALRDGNAGERERLAGGLGRQQAELRRLELAERNLESTWLFIERGDTSLLADEREPTSPTDVRMRIVEAREAERANLAQDVHDGPAQAMSNAIFQLEYIDRVLDGDPALARSELRVLRERLRHQLGEVRTFITQLRPPLLDQLGLEGALREAIEHATSIMGTAVEVELGAPGDRIPETEQIVVLRVTQEALQNVRKHAAASRASVVTCVEGDAWVLEIRDDGRGFDIGAVAARGRQNFGLQFMRERAELIGAALDVRSRPNEGTVVRLAIPLGAEESR